MASKYRLPILMYHSIIQNVSEKGKHNIYVTLKNINKQLRYLKNNGYETITFRDISEGKVKNFNKKIILTFDDGYEDNYNLLFPILKELNFTAVIYLVPRQTYNKWGVDEGEPRKNLMSKAQILEMHAFGIEFGGHTCTHIDLSRASDTDLKTEVFDCKKEIESYIPVKCISFAYPFGGLNEKVKSETKAAGYEYGIATKSGPIDFDVDPFQIRRIEIATKTNMFNFKRKVSGHYLTRKFILF
jgi:peptidoglycan/xylan/chitin deacetylase (PgdA/CDA1 family)